MIRQDGNVRLLRIWKQHAKETFSNLDLDSSRKGMQLIVPFFFHCVQNVSSFCIYLLRVVDNLY